MAIVMFSALRKPFYGLLAYWWFAIFRPLDFIYADLYSFKLPLITAVIFILISFKEKNFPYLKDVVAVTMLVFIAFMGLSRLANGCSDVFITVDPMGTLIPMFVAVLVSVSVVKNTKELFWLVVLVGFSLGFYASKAGFHSLLGGGSSYGVSNLKGLFTGSNAFAFGSVFFLFFNIFILQQCFNENTLSKFSAKMQKLIKLGRYGLIPYCLGIVYNVVSLESRGNAISLMIGLLVLFLLNNKRLKKVVLMLPVVAIGIAFVPLPDGYKERIQSVFAEEEERDASAASRPHFWSIARKMVADHPMGVGPECYREYYNYYDDTGGRFGLNRVVHSTHFQILAEHGYIGFAIWGFMLLYNYRRLFKLRRIAKDNSSMANASFYKQLCDALICSQTCFIFSGIFYSFMYGDFIWLLFGLSMIVQKLFLQELEAEKKPTARDLKPRRSF